MPYEELFKLVGGEVQPSDQMQSMNLSGKTITATTFSGNVSGNLTIAAPAIAAANGANDAALAANSANGTGLPTTLAQAGWLKVKDSAGNDCWIPYWV